jgi:hypothetical protein
MGNRRLQMRAVAQMHMPVIGTREGNRMEHGWCGSVHLNQKQAGRPWIIEECAIIGNKKAA